MASGFLRAARLPFLAMLFLHPGPLVAQQPQSLDQPAHPPRLAASPSAVASVASDAFDATYYHLTLDIYFDPDRVVGQTLVQGRVAAGSLDTLVLDLHSGVYVSSVTTPDGSALPFARVGHALRIDLPGAPASPEEVAVVVSYEAPPADGTDSAPGTDAALLMGERSGNPFAWTLSEPYGARTWWPSKDHPSDKADSIRITVSVPDLMQVAANGLLRSEPEIANGRATYDWFSRYPISTYLVSIAAGVYDYHEQTYVRPPDLEAEFGPLSLPIVHYQYEGTNFFADTSAIRGWDKAINMFPVFERWFGPYPFSEEKYGHAQFTWGGGMEHQTISSMGGNTVGLIAHELAHQWFGDLITLETWPHLWLNEGFASYAELLYYEEDAARFWNDPWNQVFFREYGRARAARGTLVVQDTSSFNNLFDATRVYAKGAMVLHMLRQVVGDENFRQILRAYTASDAFRYGNANTADFQSVAESVSRQVLDPFFRQWVTEGTGEPVYRVRWYYQPADVGYRVTVDLEQTQSMDESREEDRSNVEVFVMPVTFEVRTSETAHRFTFVNDQRVQQFQFDVPMEPVDLVFDPDFDILHRADVQAVDVDGPPLPRPALSIEAIYPNPASSEATLLLSRPLTEPAQLHVFDVLGRQVREMNLSSGVLDVTLPVRDLAPGTYIVRIDNDAESVSTTLTVAR